MYQYVFNLFICLSVSPSVCPSAQARSAGTSACKWLLVNIQDTQEFASQVLNRDVWNNPKVKETIKSNFIFWQVCAGYITAYTPALDDTLKLVGGRVKSVAD